MKKLIVFLVVLLGCSVADAQIKKLGSEDENDYTRRSEIFVSKFQSGMKGYFSSHVLEVADVVDDNNMIVVVKNMEFEQDKGKAIWLKMSSKDMVDGTLFAIVDHPIKVIGTVSYETAASTKKTLWSIELLQGEELDNLKKFEEEFRRKMIEKYGDPAKRSSKQEVQSGEFRTFKSADDKFAVEAKFIEYKDGSVKLVRKSDNKEITVKMNVLSASDVKWVQAKLREQKAARDQEKVDAKLRKLGIEEGSAEWISGGGSKQQFKP